MWFVVCFCLYVFNADELGLIELVVFSDSADLIRAEQRWELQIETIMITFFLLVSCWGQVLQVCGFAGFFKVALSGMVCCCICARLSANPSERNTMSISLFVVPTFCSCLPFCFYFCASCARIKTFIPLLHYLR